MQVWCQVVSGSIFSLRFCHRFVVVGGKPGGATRKAAAWSHLRVSYRLTALLSDRSADYAQARRWRLRSSALFAPQRRVGPAREASVRLSVALPVPQLARSPASFLASAKSNPSASCSSRFLRPARASYSGLAPPSYSKPCHLLERPCCVRSSMFPFPNRRVMPPGSSLSW